MRSVGWFSATTLPRYFGSSRTCHEVGAGETWITELGDQELRELVADRDRPFSDADRALLGSIANHAAVALEHGRAVMRGVLAQEIHHRVKNNLQTIAALLRLQARRTGNAEVADQLRETIGRIISVAVVHEILSHEETSVINIHEVSNRILNEVRTGVWDHGRPITLSLEGLPPCVRGSSLAIGMLGDCYWVGVGVTLSTMTPSVSK